MRADCSTVAERCARRVKRGKTKSALGLGTRRGGHSISTPYSCVAAMILSMSGGASGGITGAGSAPDARHLADGGGPAPPEEMGGWS